MKLIINNGKSSKVEVREIKWANWQNKFFPRLSSIINGIRSGL